jgi:hypothetical protein
MVLDTRSLLVYGKIVTDVYQLDVLARPGDVMRVYYESGGDVSDYAQFVIERTALLPDAGSAVPADARPD